MSRKKHAEIHFDAIAIEGGLFPAEWLARVAALDAPEQKDAYGIPKGLQLRDELGRSWRIAQAIHAEFDAARQREDHEPAAVSRKFVRELLGQVFGFNDIEPAPLKEIAGRSYPVTFDAHAGRVPVVVGVHARDLDKPDELHGDGTRKRTAFGLLQDYLNASDDALWGMVCNGRELRLARDNASLTRPAWVSADLERIFAEERFADFSVLWLLIHASRFGSSGQQAQDAPLEQWRNAAREQGTRARDELRLGVEEALASLGQGFLTPPANKALREKLASGELTRQAYFNQLLRLIYRLIFLLTVEERGLLHPPGTPWAVSEVYSKGFGLRRLRERALRRSAHDRHPDLWESLRPVFGGLASGEPRLGLPALGGLFGPDQCADLDNAQLENRALLAAVHRLAWLKEDSSLTRVNWRDMGPEELGSVYESLLELVPVITDDGRGFAFATQGETKGNARKLTGSYYTPDDLVQELLDSALEPVVAQKLAAHPESQEQALLSISVIDPACGSGHFLLGAARRLATHLARSRAGGTPTPQDYRHALRDVVTHCIFGVDRNPMAVELARTALWLETFTADRPLGFLDHHLQCGDALLGLLDLNVIRDGIPDEAFKALTGDDKEVCKALTKRNRQARKQLEDSKGRQFSLELTATDLGKAFAELDASADDSLADIAAKRRAHETLQAQAQGGVLALAADMYVAAFLAAKTGANQHDMPTSEHLVHLLLGNGAVATPVAGFTRTQARQAQVFHYALAFPQVMAKGGFDVALGNPPWERMKLQEQEFFAVRYPPAAQAKNKAEREKVIRSLADAPAGSMERVIYAEFEQARHAAEAASVFAHMPARFPLTGVGDVNTYALFAETFYRLVSLQGRAGFIVPTGIATDDSTKQFFAEVSQQGRLANLYDIENSAPVFPSVHRSFKFCLLTLGKADAADFVCFATQVSQLADTRRRFRLTPDEFLLINPNTRTFPIFRSNADADITRKIYRGAPILLRDDDKSGNPWGFDYMTKMFDMADSSHEFIDLSEIARDRAKSSRCLPLYEAKHIHLYDHRWASSDFEVGDVKSCTDSEKMDPEFKISTRYWIPKLRVEERISSKKYERPWLMGWRDICRATDERTMIAAVFPRIGVAHTLRVIFLDKNPRYAAAFLANISSLPFDYICRQKIGGTHLTVELLKQLPVIPPERYTESLLTPIVQRVLELTYTANDLAPWAADLGYTGAPFAWHPDRRAVLRAELDACYAHLYGLTRDELRYVLDPTDVMGDDYPSETFRVLKSNDIKAFGEYRTRRLVLEAWDRLQLASTDISVPESIMPAYVYPGGRQAARVYCGLAVSALKALGSMSQASLREVIQLALSPDNRSKLLSSEEVIVPLPAGMPAADQDYDLERALNSLRERGAIREGAGRMLVVLESSIGSDISVLPDMDALVRQAHKAAAILRQQKADLLGGAEADDASRDRKLI